MEVRRYRAGEEAEIWSLYYGTMRTVVARDYTKEQSEHWAPDDKDMNVWAERLASRKPFVAVIKSQIVGFAELEPNGHIDCFYCHKDFQRQGIGSALMAKIEEEARNQELAVLFAEVSITARDFFIKNGFEITEEREAIVCDAPAKQLLMRKNI